MNAPRLERIGAASGILFLVLVGVSFAVVPAPPKLGDITELTRYTTENRTGLLWQVYLGLGAVALVLWFAGSVRAHLRRNEGEPGRLASIAFGGAIASAMLFLVSMAMYGASAFRPGDEARVQLLNDMGAIAMMFAWIPAAVWAGATAIASLRSRALPIWHAGLSGLTAIVSLAAPAMIFNEEGYFSLNEPFGAWTLAFGLFGVWVLSTSILLIVGEAAKIEAAAEPHEGWHLTKAVGG